MRAIAQSGAKWLVACGVILAALLMAACGGGGAGSPSTGTEEAPRSEAAASAGSGVLGERIPTAGGTFTRVSPKELRSTLRDEDLVLVNTHVPFEGDIPGTDLSIPYDEIGRNLERLPGKDEKIALYCRRGSMSASAAETLVRLGYDNVWDLEGGMIAWQEAGYQLDGV